MNPMSLATSRTVLSITVAVALSACSTDFTPRSLLVEAEAPRVLAIEARPFQVGWDDPLALRLHAWPTTGVEPSWSFCPFSVGASVAYQCIIPACEVPLTPAADGTVGTVRSLFGQLPADCTGGAGAELLAVLPSRVNLLFRCVTTYAGRTRETIQLVPFYPGGAPAEGGASPSFLELTIGGVVVVENGSRTPGAVVPPLPRDGKLEVRARLAPAQTYVDEAGVTLEETLVLSFYTTAGRFDYDRANGPEGSVKLEYEAIVDETVAQVWVVATNLRGGQTVVGPFQVAIVH